VVVQPFCIKISGKSTIRKYFRGLPLFITLRAVQQPTDLSLPYRHFVLNTLFTLKRVA